MTDDAPVDTPILPPSDDRIQPEYEAKMQHLARVLDDFFNGDLRDVDGGRCSYISNGAERRDIVVLMKEMIARFEGQPQMRGSA